jgi:hypothetical protein
MWICLCYVQYHRAILNVHQSYVIIMIIIIIIITTVVVVVISITVMDYT